MSGEGQEREAPPRQPGPAEVTGEDSPSNEEERPAPRRHASPPGPSEPPDGVHLHLDLLGSLFSSEDKSSQKAA